MERWEKGDSQGVRGDELRNLSEHPDSDIDMENDWEGEDREQGNEGVALTRVQQHSECFWPHSGLQPIK